MEKNLKLKCEVAGVAEKNRAKLEIKGMQS